VKATLKVGELLSAIKKGSAAIKLNPKEKGVYHGHGIIAVNGDRLGVRAVVSNSSSIDIAKPASLGPLSTDGQCCLSLLKLMRLLSPLGKEKEVEFRYDAPGDLDSVGKVVFKCGKSTWDMSCIDHRLIPSVGASGGKKGLRITKENLKAAISSIAFAANLKDSAFINTNICVSGADGKILFGATDGIRCATKILHTDSTDEVDRFLLPVELTKSAVQFFEKGDIEIFLEDGSVRLQQGGFFVRFALPDASDVKKFPQFEKMVGGKYPFAIRVMRTRLISVIETCKENNFEECLLVFNGDALEATSFDPVNGVNYKSSVSYTGDKLNFEVGVCPIYFYEYLKTVDAEVLHFEFPFNDKKPPHIKVSDGEGTFYLMKTLADLIYLPTDGQDNAD